MALRGLLAEMIQRQGLIGRKVIDQIEATVIGHGRMEGSRRFQGELKVSGILVAAQDGFREGSALPETFVLRTHSRHIGT